LVAQEQERRHIARELHDEIGQSLTALKMDLQKAQQQPLPMPASLEDSLLLVNDILHQVRSLSLTLRPSLLDDLGLVAALRWYIDQQIQRTGIGMQLVTAPLIPRFSTDVETVCFRITQEALTNVIRHAQAQQVQIELQHEATILQLRIRDDGAGFDVGAAPERAVRGASMGLLGMQEWVQLAGGQLAITSNPQRGTKICAQFPLQRQAYESNSHCIG
jgi:signal transduction histidine kinase